MLCLIFADYPGLAESVYVHSQAFRAMDGYDACGRGTRRLCFYCVKSEKNAGSMSIRAKDAVDGY